MVIWTNPTWITIRTSDFTRKVCPAPRWTASWVPGSGYQPLATPLKEEVRKSFKFYEPANQMNQVKQIHPENQKKNSKNIWFVWPVWLWYNPMLTQGAFTGVEVNDMDRWIGKLPWRLSTAWKRSPLEQFPVIRGFIHGGVQLVMGVPNGWFLRGNPWKSR